MGKIIKLLYYENILRRESIPIIFTHPIKYLTNIGVLSFKSLTKAIS